MVKSPAASTPAARRQARDSYFEAAAQALQEKGLWRTLHPLVGGCSPTVRIGAEELLLFCSNNYLGLATDPRVTEAAATAARTFGSGSGASRLVSGTLALHTELERRLAALKGTADCVLFSSGYLANSGTIPALVGRGDTVVSDQLNHASIIDGCRLSGAETFDLPARGCCRLRRAGSAGARPGPGGDR